MKTPDINLRVLVSGQEGSSERKLQRKVVEEGPPWGGESRKHDICRNVADIVCGENFVWRHFHVEQF